MVEYATHGVGRNTIIGVLGARQDSGKRKLGALAKLALRLQKIEESKFQLDMGFYRAIRERLHIPEEQQRKLLQRYRGSFLCYRMSATSNEVWVTFLRIWDQNNDSVPRFEEIAHSPAETSPWGSLHERTFDHSGFVYARANRIYFLSASSGNFRELIAIPSSTSSVRNLIELYLTVDATPSAATFASRVALRYQGEVPFERVRSSCGGYKLDDPEVREFLPFIENSVQKAPVLRAVVDQSRPQ